MHRTACISTILLFTLAAGSQAADHAPIQATLQGVLDVSPNAAVPGYLRLNGAATSQFGPLVALILPGDEFGNPKAWVGLLGREVLVTGQLQIGKDILQKDGALRKDLSVTVQQMQFADSREYIVGPCSPDGRWVAVSYRNGLKLYDTTRRRKGHEIYPPFGAPPGSQINWSSSARFSPCGKYVVTSRGLDNDVWSLPDVQRVEFHNGPNEPPAAARNVGGDRRPKEPAEVFDFVGDFSANGKYLIKWLVVPKGIVFEMVVYRMETGESVARLPITERVGHPQTAFLPDGHTLAVIDKDMVTLLSLSTGKQLASVRTESAPPSDSDNQRPQKARANQFQQQSN